MHQRWLNSQFPPFFSILNCPLGLGKLQACSFTDVVFPPLLLSALSSALFHCALQDGFGQTWWTGDMCIPLQFVSLYNGHKLQVPGLNYKWWGLQAWDTLQDSTDNLTHEYIKIKHNTKRQCWWLFPHVWEFGGKVWWIISHLCLFFHSKDHLVCTNSTLHVRISP